MENVIRAEQTQLRWLRAPHPIPIDQVAFEQLAIQTDASWEGYSLVLKFGQGETVTAVPVVDGLADYPTGLNIGDCEISLEGYPPEPDSGIRAAATRLRMMFVPGSLPGGNPPVPPTPDLYAQLLQQLEATGGKIAPVIGPRETWLVWDNAQKMLIDSGLKARGPQGLPGTPGDPGKPPLISASETWLLWDPVADVYVDSRLPARGPEGKPGSVDPEALAQAVADYLAKHPVQAPVQSVNGQTGDVQLNIPNVPSWALQPTKPAYTAQETGALPASTVIPDVPSWAMQPTKPSYTAQEVGAIPASTPIPPAYDDTEIRQMISEKYTKPAGGIPAEDLAAGVIPTIPQALPNPHALTFAGAVTGVYDGSQPMTVKIPSGGGGGGETEEWATIFDGTIGADAEGDVVTQHILLKGGRNYKKIMAASVGKQSANAMLCCNHNVTMPDTYAGTVSAIADSIKVAMANFAYAQITPNVSGEFLEVRSRASGIGTTAGITNETVAPISAFGIGSYVNNVWYHLQNSGIDTISLYTTNASVPLAKTRLIIKGVPK